MTLVLYFQQTVAEIFLVSNRRKRKREKEKKDFPFYQAKAKQTKWKFRNFPFGLHYSL